MLQNVLLNIVAVLCKTKFEHEVKLETIFGNRQISEARRLPRRPALVAATRRPGPQRRPPRHSHGHHQHALAESS